MKRALAGLLIALGAALLYRTRTGRACGPFFTPPVFTAITQPDPPPGPYTRGRLGVLQPRYNRIYLYVAYRNLAGAGFNRAEALSLWNLSPDTAYMLDGSAAPPGAEPPPPTRRIGLMTGSISGTRCPGRLTLTTFSPGTAPRASTATSRDRMAVMPLS